MRKMLEVEKTDSNRYGKEEEKACQRLDMINYVVKTGNISEACRTSSCSRRSFYKWYNRYKVHGFAGLFDLQAGRKVSQECSPALEFVKQIILSNPNIGPSNIARQCRELGIAISASSVQKYLNSLHLGTIKDRIRFLEKQIVNGTMKNPSADLIKMIESYNARFRDRSLIAEPGLNLIQGVRHLPLLNENYKFYVQVAIDTKSQLAFCHVHKGCTEFDAKYLLESKALPIFSRFDLKLNTVFTPNNKIYLNKNGIYQKFLEKKHIAHEVISNLYRGGCLEVVFQEIKRKIPLRKYISSADLGELVDNILHDYNNKKIHCFPSFDESPRVTFENYTHSQ